MFSFLQICCPNNAVNPPKCDPKVPKCDYNDYDEESESFGYKCCGFINDEIRELDEFWYGPCQNGTVCSSATQCGIKGIFVKFLKCSRHFKNKYHNQFISKRQLINFVFVVFLRVSLRGLFEVYFRLEENSLPIYYNLKMAKSGDFEF